MKSGNAHDFIDHATYEEVAVMYQGVKYFFYGLILNSEGRYSFDIDIWDTDGNAVQTVFSGTFNSKDDCMSVFENSKIFNGKTFWEAEKDMEWVEW